MPLCSYFFGEAYKEVAEKKRQKLRIVSVMQYLFLHKLLIYIYHRVIKMRGLF